MVKDVNGFPIKDIKLTISFVWAVPDVWDPTTSPTYGVVQFYHVGSKVNSPFNVSTDGNGAYVLRMDFDTGLVVYKGTLTVTSGSAYGSADFEVKTS